MADPRQLWVLAGGNGAGKSTFYHLCLAGYGVPFVNADLIARDLRPENPEEVSYHAATLADQIREDLIAQRISFCFETVFSHESKIDFLARAKAHDYRIILVYIHLFDSSLNEARVRQRISEGGHRVPIDKIHSRIPRTLQHIKNALSLVDEARILDNSSKKDPFKQIIVMQAGNYEIKADILPEWAKDLFPA